MPDYHPTHGLWTGDYRPLRVRAYMASALSILPHEGLPLDGILEAAAHVESGRILDAKRAAGGKVFVNGDGWPTVRQYCRVTERGEWWLSKLNESTPINYALPVKRCGHRGDPDWFWCCSWATFPEGMETDRTHWNRRFDGNVPELGPHLDFGDRRGSISMASGRYKSYHMPLCLVVAPVVEWFCLGALDGVMRLLKEITHLGKKRSQGHGEVLRWQVWPAREDWSCWRDGRPMRALPDQVGDFERGAHAIRPPSWHHARRRACILPDSHRRGSAETAYRAARPAP